MDSNKTFVSALVTFTFLLLVFGLHDLSEVLDGLLTVGGAVTGLSLRRNDPHLPVPILS
jgi:hypothetical protein